MKSDDLPPLRDVIKDHGLDARKALGQHFLLDLNITRKIARLANAEPNDNIIEVGPGPGGLTRALLESGAHVSVIERDERCLNIMDELKPVWAEKLTILHEDALHTDYKNLLAGKTPVKFVSNLPYNISTELLVRWLSLPKGSWQQMTLMFQREVADRILAAPGSKTYGRLSILAQSASRPARGLNLPAKAFTPPPKVSSTVVTFEPNNYDSLNLSVLEVITRAAFSQRRKMVRSSLKQVFGKNLEDALNFAEIPITTRAEDIPVETYHKLTKFLERL